MAPKNAFAGGAYNEASTVTQEGYENGRRIFESATVDSDMTNEAAWLARPELERQWREENARELAEQQAKARADKSGVRQASVTKLDTDHTDEEAWLARTKLKQRSDARRKKEKEELEAANAKFFGKVKETKRSEEIDDNLMDEWEWQIRPDLDKQNVKLKEREADDLKDKNVQYRKRLQRIKPKVEITSLWGTSEFVKPEWEEAAEFDKASTFMPRAREKYVSRLNWSSVAPTNLQVRPPSWLKAWESYDWGERKDTIMADRATSGHTFGVAEDAANHEKVVAKRAKDVAEGRVSDFKNGLATKSGVF